MKRELRYKGSFYPENKSQIADFIKKNSHGIKKVHNLKGLILPHAGWIYSGSAALKGLSHTPAEHIRNIYLIGPSHHFSFKGIALSRFTTYEAVSGDFNLNKQIEQDLLNIPGVSVLDDAHIHEHSLEVLLEFLRHYYSEANLIPIVAGVNSSESLQQILNRSLNEPGSLTIISSDLSHYQPYKIATNQDKKSIQTIVEGVKDLNFDDACGFYIINALLNLNRKTHQFNINLLEYKNSGDSAGDKLSVVGYGALEIVSNG